MQSTIEKIKERTETLIKLVEFNLFYIENNKIMEFNKVIKNIKLY